MLKEKFEQILEILEAVTLNPYRFPELAKTRKKELGFISELVTVFASLGLSVGAVYMTPPYTKSWQISILVMSTVFYLFFRILPLLFAAFADHSIRKSRERKENVMLAVLASRILLAVFILFTPFSVILVQSGLSGGRVYYALFVFFMLLYLYLAAKMLSVLYELEFKATIAVVLKSLGLVFVFPLLFNIVFGHSIVKFLE